MLFELCCSHMIFRSIKNHLLFEKLRIMEGKSEALVVAIRYGMNSVKRFREVGWVIGTEAIRPVPPARAGLLPSQS